MNINTAPYDVMKVREDFPILREKPYGKPLVYLDNGASAQKPKQVDGDLPCSRIIAECHPQRVVRKSPKNHVSGATLSWI